MSADKIKCIVWDLDNTLWQGILLEDSEVTLVTTIVDVIKTLDARGILHSIASRNDHAAAEKKLRELGLWDYFIYPAISWCDKSSAIERIARQINIGINTLAFVDDQPFELDEVRSRHPEVAFFTPEAVPTFLHRAEFMPRFITVESALRRQYYQSDILRNHAESDCENNIAFLESLGLALTINKVTTADLERAEELTLRTHQLNTTGTTYTYEQLHHYMLSDTHELFCCSLIDKYGAYGTIGLSLIEKNTDHWLIQLLLMSCRVMSRNIGNTLLAFIARLATQEQVKLRARFIQNDRNRQMYITYKFNGFEEIQRNDKEYLLELTSREALQLPHYIQVESNLI